jgi:hypothetical protein
VSTKILRYCYLSSHRDIAFGPNGRTKRFGKIEKEDISMHIVKSVGVLSVAKIMGMIHACMGLLFVPFILLMSVVGSMAGQDKNPFAGMLGIGFAVVRRSSTALWGSS